MTAPSARGVKGRRGPVDAGPATPRTITTVAGTGRESVAGDGGPTVRAQLSPPMGLALDKTGNLFVADAGNNRIRKITAQRVIFRVAGSGSTGYLQGSFGGDGGPATEAELGPGQMSS